MATRATKTATLDAVDDDVTTTKKPAARKPAAKTTRARATTKAAAPASAAEYGSRTMREGTSGGDVTQLQRYLNRAGFPTTADGAFEIQDGDAAELGTLAAQHQLVLHELSPQRASLEEAFMRLTAEAVEYHAGGPVGSSPSGVGALPQGVPAGQAPAA